MPGISSIQFCQTILDVKRIVLGAQNLCQPDSHKQYDKYYLVSVVTDKLLQRDVTQYYLLRRREAKSRRVCILIAGEENTHCDALILDFSALNIWIMEILEQKLSSKNSSVSLDGIFNYPEFKVLYKKVKCTYFSTTNQQEKLRLLLPCICRAYNRSEITVTFQQFPDTNTPKLLFTELVLQFIENGVLGSIDVQNTVKKYQKCCAQTLIEQLAAVNDIDHELFNRIIDSLQILLKYQLLHSRRKRLPIDKIPIEQLELNWRRYLLLKKEIYSGKIQNVLACCHNITLFTLVNLLSCRNNSLLHEWLLNEQKTQLDEMHKWERDFQNRIAAKKQSWGSYLKWLGKKTLNTLYNVTFIGLAAELAHGFLKMATDIVVITSSAEQGKRKVIHGISKVANVFLSRYTIRVCAMADACLKQGNILRFSKIIGGGMGLYYTWLMGGYQLVRLLTVNCVGMKVYEHFNRNRLNDHQASSVGERFPVNTVYILRGMNLLFAGVESIYMSNSCYMLYALGGTAGSISATTSARYIFPELKRRPGQPQIEEQMLMLFFAAIAGQNVGHMLTMYGKQIYDNWNTCLIAAQRLNESSHEHAAQMIESVRPLAWSAECKRSLWSPRLWFSNEQPLRFSFTTADKKFVDMTCQATRTSAFYGIIDCQEAEESDILRLTS